MNRTEIGKLIEAQKEAQSVPFSGAVLVNHQEGVIWEQAYGYANRSDKLINQTTTRFGIASGCKIFTAVAVLQLVEKGLLELDTLLKDRLDGTFPHFDPGITVRHLLTHTSGIPDYFDEESMIDFEDLWKSSPMYTMTSPASFLPLFQNKEMKFIPGERFSYNNAGYILLGLLVERAAGMTFPEYVQAHIFTACGMEDSGYFRLDRLPERTAVGYIEEGAAWRTNLYSLPIIGGPDGGAFTTVYDLDRFWCALLENRLLSERMTRQMLSPQSRVNEFNSYGLGVWLLTIQGEVEKYYVMGYDPGVQIHSAVYPRLGMRVHLLSNNGAGAGWMAKQLDTCLLG